MYDHTTRTPIQTYNRFEPLQDRNTRTTPYNTYGYTHREEDPINRSPFNSNYSHTGPLHRSDFPRDTDQYPEIPERREAPEGGGGSKRKRT